MVMVVEWDLATQLDMHVTKELQKLDCRLLTLEAGRWVRRLL